MNDCVGYNPAECGDCLEMDDYTTNSCYKKPKQSRETSEAVVRLNNLLSVERNFCKCHPDTCSCDDWNIIYNGEILARHCVKEKLDKLIKIISDT